MFRHQSAIRRDSSRTKEYKSSTLVWVLYRHYWNDQNIKMLEHIMMTSINYNVVM